MSMGYLPRRGALLKTSVIAKRIGKGKNAKVIYHHFKRQESHILSHGAMAHGSFPCSGQHFNPLHVTHVQGFQHAEENKQYNLPCIIQSSPHVLTVNALARILGTLPIKSDLPVPVNLQNNAGDFSRDLSEQQEHETKKNTSFSAYQESSVITTLPVSSVSGAEQPPKDQTADLLFFSKEDSSGQCVNNITTLSSVYGSSEKRKSTVTTSRLIKDPRLLRRGGAISSQTAQSLLHELKLPDNEIINQFTGKKNEDFSLIVKESSLACATRDKSDNGSVIPEIRLQKQAQCQNASATVLNDKAHSGHNTVLQEQVACNQQAQPKQACELQLSNYSDNNRSSECPNMENTKEIELKPNPEDPVLEDLRIHKSQLKEKLKKYSLFLMLSDQDRWAKIESLNNMSKSERIQFYHRLKKYDKYYQKYGQLLGFIQQKASLPENNETTIGKQQNVHAHISMPASCLSSVSSSNTINEAVISNNKITDSLYSKELTIVTCHTQATTDTASTETCQKIDTILSSSIPMENTENVNDNFVRPFVSSTEDQELTGQSMECITAVRAAVSLNKVPSVMITPGELTTSTTGTDKTHGPNVVEDCYNEVSAVEQYVMCLGSTTKYGYDKQQLFGGKTAEEKQISSPDQIGNALTHMRISTEKPAVVKTTLMDSVENQIFPHLKEEAQHAGRSREKQDVPYNIKSSEYYEVDVVGNLPKIRSKLPLIKMEVSNEDQTYSHCFETDFKCGSNRNCIPVNVIEEKMSKEFVTSEMMIGREFKAFSIESICKGVNPIVIKVEESEDAFQDNAVESICKGFNTIVVKIDDSEDEFLDDAVENICKDFGTTVIKIEDSENEFPDEDDLQCWLLQSRIEWEQLFSKPKMKTERSQSVTLANTKEHCFNEDNRKYCVCCSKDNKISYSNKVLNDLNITLKNTCVSQYNLEPQYTTLSGRFSTYISNNSSSQIKLNMEKKACVIQASNMCSDFLDSSRVLDNVVLKTDGDSGGDFDKNSEGIVVDQEEQSQEMVNDSRETGPVNHMLSKKSSADSEAQNKFYSLPLVEVCTALPTGTTNSLMHEHRNASPKNQSTRCYPEDVTTADRNTSVCSLTLAVSGSAVETEDSANMSVSNISDTEEQQHSENSTTSIALNLEDGKASFFTTDITKLLESRQEQISEKNFTLCSGTKKDSVSLPIKVSFMHVQLEGPRSSKGETRVFQDGVCLESDIREKPTEDLPVDSKDKDIATELQLNDNVNTLQSPKKTLEMEDELFNCSDLESSILHGAKRYKNGTSIVLVSSSENKVPDFLSKNKPIISDALFLSNSSSMQADELTKLESYTCEMQGLPKHSPETKNCTLSDKISEETAFENSNSELIIFSGKHRTFSENIPNCHDVVQNTEIIDASAKPCSYKDKDVQISFNCKLASIKEYEQDVNSQTSKETVEVPDESEIRANIENSDISENDGVFAFHSHSIPLEMEIQSTFRDTDPEPKASNAETKLKELLSSSSDNRTVCLKTNFLNSNASVKNSAVAALASTQKIKQGVLNNYQIQISGLAECFHKERESSAVEKGYARNISCNSLKGEENTQMHAVAKSHNVKIYEKVTNKETPIWTQSVLLTSTTCNIASDRNKTYLDGSQNYKSGTLITDNDLQHLVEIKRGNNAKTTKQVINRAKESSISGAVGLESTGVQYKPVVNTGNCDVIRTNCCDLISDNDAQLHCSVSVTEINYVLKIVDETSSLEILEQQNRICRKMLPVFTEAFEQQQDCAVQEVLVTRTLLLKKRLQIDLKAISLKSQALDSFVELQMIMEAVQFIENKISFLKAEPTYRSLLWYDSTLYSELLAGDVGYQQQSQLYHVFQESLKYKPMSELKNYQAELSRHAKENRKIASYYAYLKNKREIEECNAVLQNYNDMSSFSLSVPLTCALNVGDSIEELTVLRESISDLMERYRHPGIQCDAGKQEHLLILLHFIYAKINFLNECQALKAEVEWFGLEHLLFDAVKAVVWKVKSKRMKTQFSSTRFNAGSAGLESREVVALKINKAALSLLLELYEKLAETGTRTCGGNVSSEEFNVNCGSDCPRKTSIGDWHVSVNNVAVEHPLSELNNPYHSDFDFSTVGEIFDQVQFADLNTLHVLLLECKKQLKTLKQYFQILQEVDVDDVLVTAENISEADKTCSFHPILLKPEAVEPYIELVMLFEMVCFLENTIAKKVNKPRYRGMLWFDLSLLSELVWDLKDTVIFTVLRNKVENAPYSALDAAISELKLEIEIIHEYRETINFAYADCLLSRELTELLEVRKLYEEFDEFNVSPPPVYVSITPYTASVNYGNTEAELEHNYNQFSALLENLALASSKDLGKMAYVMKVMCTIKDMKLLAGENSMSALSLLIYQMQENREKKILLKGKRIQTIETDVNIVKLNSSTRRTTDVPAVCLSSHLSRKRLFREAATVSTSEYNENDSSACKRKKQTI
ncbi:testis-expressed protein 15 [Protopterus annectens]|uniref:testis-expressed protein 15 n=1 Tax=Protopterus annectens TaxID=7888 RepID=UPI001CFA16E0|nr:testis-expressed protein 15 [Protopterus annectens]